MKASDAEVGKKYLSKKGDPVTVVGSKGDQIVVRIDAIGKQVEIPKHYELRPYDSTKVNAESKSLEKAYKNGKGERKTREGTLASIIDPFLLQGGKTIVEIAAVLGKKAGAAGKGKDLAANVRARMVAYTRKGWRVEKDAKKHIKVVRNKA